MTFEELKALSDGLPAKTDEQGMIYKTVTISPRIFMALVDEIERLRARVKSLENDGAFPPGWMPPGR